MERLERSSNSINIASFWENFELKKYNFDPDYQRRGDVWNENKKSFLIDTIFKNFPMPPIFLHQHIDSGSGKTVYEIIDGKQRLQSIVDFINNKIALPPNFSEDTFGNEKLNGLYFKDLDNEDLSEYKKSFWRYIITIEYIDSDDRSVINNIFDRLNRNGEPLNPQELRKAKYSLSSFYRMAEDLSRDDYWTSHLSRIEVNRYDDVEFVSELLFVLITGEIKDASMKINLDSLYDEYCSSAKELEMQERFNEYVTQFRSITQKLDSFALDFKGFKIDSVSHLYGLWGFAWRLVIENNNNNYSERLNEFYTQLRSKDFSNENVKAYSTSMQANTKAKSSRLRRLNALLNYCGLQNIVE